MKCDECYEFERSPKDTTPCPVCEQRKADERVRQLECFARFSLEVIQETRVQAISVWPFYEAPLCLRELSTNGGDEDWVVYVPPGMTGFDYTPSWIDHLDSCHNPDRFEFPDGSIVFIGAHA